MTFSPTFVFVSEDAEIKVIGSSPRLRLNFCRAALQAPIAFCQPEVGRKIFFTIARVERDLDFEGRRAQNPNPA